MGYGLDDVLKFVSWVLQCVRSNNRIFFLLVLELKVVYLLHNVADCGLKLIF